MSEITIENVLQEIGITNTVLNTFNTTFDMGWTSKWFLGVENVWDLRNYRIVTPQLYEAILAKKEELVFFKQEYYRKKTVKEISLMTGMPVSVVCEHLNRKKSYYHYTILDEVVTAESLLSHCSAFTVLKNIQKEYLAERFQLQINK